MINNIKPLVGAHVSITGGFFKAIEHGTQIGCTAIQIFTKSNRQWHAPSINHEEAQQFITAQKNSDIKVVVTHACYLINLGSSTPDVPKKSFRALVDEIKRCDILQIPFLILHPGTGDYDNLQDSLKKTGDYINQALQETADCLTTVLIETMAGQGKSIGSNFEQLATIINQVEDKKRIGVCFDTCHTFVAGYDFTTTETYNATFTKFDEIIGLHYLKCFHINDSKKELGSCVDRHEEIGQGTIKLQAFAKIMNDPRFVHVPKILEVPVGEDDVADYQRNIATLLSLIE